MKDFEVTLNLSYVIEAESEEIATMRFMELIDSTALKVRVKEIK